MTVWVRDEEEEEEDWRGMKVSPTGGGGVRKFEFFRTGRWIFSVVNISQPPTPLATVLFQFK